MQTQQITGVDTHINQVQFTMTKQQEPGKKKEEALREKYMELQMIFQHMKQVKEQYQQAEQQLSELNTVQESLRQLKETKNGTELLVPLSGGLFAKAALLDSAKVIVNVGASVSVEKTIDDTITLIGSQVNDIAEIHEKLHHQLEFLQSKTSELEEGFKKLAEDHKNSGKNIGEE